MGDLDLDLSFEEVEKMTSNPQTIKEDNKKTQKSEYEFEIISVLGRLSDGKGAPVLAKVKWGEYLRYDLRKWNEDMTKPFKGIAFDDEEVSALKSIPSFCLNTFSDPIAYYEGDKVKASIYSNLAVLSKAEKESGWQKEVNIVDWGFGKKIDFRKWKDDYKKCGKGISLTLDEFSKMIDLLKHISNE